MRAEQYWTEREAKRKDEAEFVASTATLAPAELVAAVKKRLDRLNADSTIVLTTTASDGRIVGATISGQPFACDVSPLQAFANLKELEIGTGDSYVLLAPLVKLPLERISFKGNDHLFWLNHPALREMSGLKTVNVKPAQSAIEAIANGR